LRVGAFWAAWSNRPISLRTTFGLLRLTEAHSTEMNPDAKYPVVINMPEVSFTNLGGTMRLGARTTVFVKDCLTSAAERTEV